MFSVIDSVSQKRGESEAIGGRMQNEMRESSLFVWRSPRAGARRQMRRTLFKALGNALRARGYEPQMNMAEGVRKVVTVTGWICPLKMDEALEHA
jgi:hypothetical protein